MAYGVVLSLVTVQKVCPKHVQPSEAVNQGKIESAKDYVFAMLKPPKIRSVK